MKSLLGFVLFFVNSMFLLAQEDDDKVILIADSTWGREVVDFPVDWAPEFDLKGYEELRFTPGWPDKSSDSFWSLAMAWRVGAAEKFDTTTVRKYLIAYFDGLMTPNNWATEFPKPKVEFGAINSHLPSTGILSMFDGFFTGKVIQLNFTVQQEYCDQEQELIVVYRFSPQPLDHSVSELLETAKLKNEPCH